MTYMAGKAPGMHLSSSLLLPAVRQPVIALQVNAPQLNGSAALLAATLLKSMPNMQGNKFCTVVLMLTVHCLGETASESRC